MVALPHLALRLNTLSARAQYLIALLCGALLACLTLAPLKWFFAFFVIVPPIIWMLDGAKRPQQSFLIGFLFALSYFLLGFYWIHQAFLISPVPYLGPIAVILLAALFSFYWGVAFFAARKIWPNDYRRFFSLAFFWAIAFWAQGIIFGGFPWNLPAQSWLFSSALAQNLSWAGIYSASFLTILCAACFAAFDQSNWRKALPLPLAAMMLFSLLWLGGLWRLQQAEVQPSSANIIIIQPNIAQIHKWDPAYRQTIINTYFSMSARALRRAAQKPTMMIWPEAALPINIERAPQLRQALASLLPPHIALTTGLLRFEHAERRKRPRVFNSLFLIDHQGEIRQTYDKNHLVPFGEYLPFQTFLERLGLQQVTGQRGGFASGQSRALLRWPSAPSMPQAVPLICFEISFPREIPKTADARRPDWIINITNDGWYGSTPGPYQHFDIARLRAIEFGLPVIRAANTGISAVIDPYGRVLKKIPLNTQGIIHAPLPKALPPTLYERLREWLFVVFLLISAILIGINSQKTYKRLYFFDNN